MSRSIRSLLVLLAIGMPILAEEESNVSVEGIREHLELRFESSERPQISTAEVLLDALAPFYQKRVYVPAWIGSQGLLPEAKELIETLEQAGSQGLDPADYHLPQINERVASASSEELSDLEVLLSDAFLRYCLDVRSGRADPRFADPKWFVFADGIDHMAALEEALASRHFGAALGSLYPPDPRYERLRRALAFHREMAALGGWPILQSEQNLEPGMQDSAVPLLRERLRLSGDLEGSNDDETYDPELAEVVRRFQLRHGLDDDAIVGGKTRSALNVPVEQRIEQIRINMERWRWMPRELGDRYLLVNMAGFELLGVEEGKRTITMRVVVGRTFRSTPAFNEPMTYLVINPYWNVPKSLATRDILPKVRKDPGYLEKMGFRMFADWSEEAEEIDADSVDWSEIGDRGFPYRLRQDPGLHNALGRIKFILPNRFNVYLHDTPHREHFDLPVRAFSSGCIRLEEPARLAAYVLRSAGWTEEKVLAAVESKKRQVIGLPDPLPVFLVYWTAWVEEDGSIHFRDDIYDRDPRLQEALDRGVPEGARSPCD